jgi:signal transduction histidine kinase
VMMPEMDGLEVCQRLKSNPKYKHIPIIMVTALNTKKDLVRCLEQGADDFLSKPIDSLELRARIRCHLRIKQQHDELEELVNLREETLTMREDMSNMIVHDLRNPLATIILATGIVQKYIDRADQRPLILKKVEQILDSAKQLQNMIDSLLFMAKLESGKILFNPVLTDLYALGIEVIKDFELMANSRQIELQSELPNVGESILIDATILRRVIDNLMSNALKFSVPNSQVSLKIEYLPDNHLRVQVADTGEGISEAEKEKIFEKFEIGTIKKNTAQTGLGLAFCKMAIETQGGNLAIADNHPQGSIFIIEI